MVVQTVEQALQGDDHSVSTESQVTDDPALKDSTNSGKSTTESGSTGSSEESSKFVKKETQHVLFLRVVVLLILFSASAAISIVVYLVSSAGEKDSFESQYHAAADKVLGTFRRII